MRKPHNLTLMRTILTVILTFFLVCSGLQAQYQETTISSIDIPSFSDDEIRARLDKIVNKVVAPRFDGVVKSYINTYTVLKREKTEAMLGRMVMYFPLFEKLLAENDMPLDLKFLSITESALNPIARSRSGAAGLWQFMPMTGKEYGLTQNRYVDLRRDPEKSTLAAIKFLKRLYRNYGNWELALAGYNGGPGRVNRAIKRGRSKNYWHIRKYLPRETRNYVSAYIAATYIANFFHLHDLVPLFPDPELQITASTTVYSTITFDEIAEITEVPLYIIEILNPAYKRNFIPSSKKGYNLILPMAKMAAFNDHFKKPDSDDRLSTAGGIIPAPKEETSKNINSRKDFYIVETGDSLSQLANAFGCSEKDIMIWNRLTTRQLRKGQKLEIYLSLTPPKPIDPIEQIEGFTITPKSSANYFPTLYPVAYQKDIPFAKFSKSKKWFKRDNAFVYHKIRRGESLYHIAEKHEVSVNDLLTLNDIKADQILKTGSKIKVKKK